MALILIADDDQQIRKLLKRIFEDAGHDTIVASNGDEAVKVYQDKRPDLSTIDIVMPEKEGIETIIELKRLNPDVKIIAISGGGKVDPKSYLAMAKQFGAAETMEKPIDRNELLLKVEKLLSGD